MSIIRFLHAVLLLALLSPAAYAQADQHLLGTFHFSLEPKENTHRFVKKEGKYFYSACFRGKCSEQIIEAFVLDDQTMSEWFPPEPRWKEIGARAIQVPGKLTLFHVERPDNEVEMYSKTKYFFVFWGFKGQAEKVD